jgi:cell division protein FtsI/penicillin-binding protein 2
MNRSAFNRRIYLTAFLLFVLFLLVTIKLFNLHFSEKIIIPHPAPVDTGRGYILDRNGYVLALSIVKESIFANPEEISDPLLVARALSPVVDISASSLLERLQRGKRFVWIKRKADDSVVESVKALNIRGIHFRNEYQRVYPYNDLAAGVIGFVGVDNTGLEGLEYSYNSILSGRDEIVIDEISREIYQKKNIRLTIDRLIQNIAEEELHAAVTSHRADQGSVVVLEVKTGRILALANIPSFNLNRYRDYNQHIRKVFTVVDSFEPGSTLKIVAAASLLEHRPDLLKKEYICTGKVEIAGVTINCLHEHGRVDMKDIIRYSCNSGIIQSMMNLEKKNYYVTLRNFGFGQETGAGLPGETAGILRPVDQWSGLSKYSMSIGHEIAVTSLQMAAAFGAIANKGVYMRPAIIESVEKPDSSVVKSFYPVSRGRIIKEKNAALLMKMMKETVETGTGRRAFSSFYKNAGKTGTSQKFIKALGSYSDRNISSFVGIAPYRNPQICVLVVIDDPGDNLTGGAAAAPVFKRIIERVLPYMGTGVRDIASAELKKSPDPGLFKGNKMPDLRGMNFQEISGILADMSSSPGVKYYIKGTGRVFAQKPLPETVLKNGDKVIINMR